MATALFRKTSGEVVKISLRNQAFADADPTFWGVLTDPAFPDGTDVRDMDTDPAGPLRVLGFSKRAVPGPIVRNATAPEIALFAPAQADDENQMDADRAGSLFETDPQTRKLFTALMDVARIEVNTLRAEHALAPRTLDDWRTAIRNRISKND